MPHNVNVEGVFWASPESQRQCASDHEQKSNRVVNKPIM